MVQRIRHPWALPQPWVHASRNAVAAIASLELARAFHLPEAYWASVTTIIVMESTIGAAWTVSKRRFIGTAMGAALAGLLGSYFRPGLAIFGGAIFSLGLICALLRLDRSAYRFAGVTLAIVFLVPREVAPWLIALHRFAEVSLGIAVGLIFAALWPGREPAGRKSPR